jgi:membrane fusion protein (multidrug efflux system)
MKINIKNKKTSGAARILIIISAIVILILAGAETYHILCYDSTDDAQIDGNIIPLRTMVSGYINDIRIKDNQLVNKGDTLIILDTVNLSAQAREADAQLEAVRTNLRLGNKQLLASRYSHSAASFSSGSAKEEIEAAKANVFNKEQEFDRINKMFAHGASTKHSYDNAKASLDIARAKLSATEKQYESSYAQGRNLKAMVSAKELEIQIEKAHIKEAEARLAQSEYLLSHEFITAPCNGIISKKSVETGQFVTAGTAMASVINISDLWITANFKETQMKNMKPGQYAIIKVDAYPGIKIKGRVESFCAATGARFSLLPAQNATGNFIKITQRIPVRISIGTIKSGKLLLPGMSVTAKVKTK